MRVSQPKCIGLGQSSSSLDNLLRVETIETKKFCLTKNALNWDNLRVETKKNKILRLRMWDEDESPNIETKETIKENESKIYSMRCFPPNYVYKEKIVFMN